MYEKELILFKVKYELLVKLLNFYIQNCLINFRILLELNAYKV